MHAAATTLGLREVEVDVTFNSMWVGPVVDGYPVAMSRVVRHGKSDYQRLTLLHQVLTDIGAGWRIALVTGFTGLLTMWLAKRLKGPQVPEFFLAGLGGIIAVAIAAVLTTMNLDVRPSLVVAASIVVLLPSIELVGSVRDALVGFSMTATGRSVEGAMLMIGIVAGILIALDVAAAASISMQIVTSGHEYSL